MWLRVKTAHTTGEPVCFSKMHLSTCNVARYTNCRHVPYVAPSYTYIDVIVSTLIICVSVVYIFDVYAE